ncbi:helicase conserved C-terminal domain protein, partial [Chlamydia psittaci 84-8471/1]
SKLPTHSDLMKLLNIVIK